MKSVLLFLLPALSVFHVIHAQQAISNSATEKGATPLTSGSNEQDFHKTYAVVVGISDYQNPAIPDLRFADKDADAFANYLRSDAGGNLERDNLKLLINQEATLGKFAAALDWLIEVCKENDRAIIYFSGHGDVERKTISLPGYLLCWDAPAQIYMSGGTFNLRDLEEVVTTLSTQNKVKTLVIADACHAGKLSGAGIGGVHIAGANLSRQYANEIKLLSCQPNELSIEGEQWGGGRGAFSFHLLEGLYGLADKNGDGIITTGEIDRYLEDHVTPQVLPMVQSPVILGNKSEQIAKVNTDFSAKLQKGKNALMATLGKTESRGLEQDVLFEADSTIRKMYTLFVKALEDKLFFDDSENLHSADYYFELLLKEPRLKRLHNYMRRNYAAALQDDAQQVLLRALNSDIRELLIPRKTKVARYQYYPKCLERASELLGSRHYMYSSLQARKLFFEGFVLAVGHRQPDTAVARQALAKFNDALLWQADMPQVYLQKSWVFAVNLKNLDSTIYFGQKAIDLYPTWLLPNVDLAYLLISKFNAFNLAIPYLENAEHLDSNSALVYNTWGNFYFQQHKYPEAEHYYLRSIKLDSGYVDPYYNLACCYSIETNVSKALYYLDQALRIGYDYQWIQNDSDLESIRKLPEWTTLMKKYFPEKQKK